MRANQNHIWDYVVCCINYTRKRIDESSAPTWKKQNKNRVQQTSSCFKENKIIATLCCFLFFPWTTRLAQWRERVAPIMHIPSPGGGRFFHPIFKNFHGKRDRHRLLTRSTWVVSFRRQPPWISFFNARQRLSFFFFQLRPRLLLLPPSFRNGGIGLSLNAPLITTRMKWRLHRTKRTCFSRADATGQVFERRKPKRKWLPLCVMTSIVLLLTVKCNPMKREEEGRADHFCQVYVINTHWWKNT